MFNERQSTLFGEGPEVSGSTNITSLMDRFITAGHDADRARLIALFHYQPIKQFLFDISENSLDEIDSLILDVSKYHAVIETLARSKRKLMEQRKSQSRQFISADRSTGWYHKYLETTHWCDIRDEASDTRDKMDFCVCNHQHPRQEWHHPTYAYCGQQSDAAIIQPICMSCHEMIHAVSRLSPPPQCPPAVRNVLSEEGIYV